MQVQVEIGFEQLMEIIKQLPSSKLSLLKRELNANGNGGAKASDIEAFLLKAPTFSKNQVEAIAKTRKAINQWRAE